MLLNVGWRLAAVQGVSYSAEWIAVGVVISLVYRGSPLGDPDAMRRLEA